MILDALLQFSSGQDLSQVVGDYVSTNVIDFGLGSDSDPAIPNPDQGGGARDMGIGDNPALKLLVQIAEAFASGGAATLQITIEGAPDDGTGAPDTFDDWWQSPVYALADLVAGARLLDMDWPRPPQGAPVPRFARLTYTIAGATTTTGTVDAYIVLDRDDQMYNGDNNAVMGGYRPGIAVAN